MAKTMSFLFQEREPVRWSGRYRRIPGRQPVLHVRRDNSIDIVWEGGDDTCICKACMTPEVRSLARAINRVKRERTGQPGGSFVINEYGQVICPVADGSFERFYVGDCLGAIPFVWPDGDSFTLNDDDDLEPGDDWILPYIGIAFNLSRNNRIYFPLREGYDTECVYPPQQDRQLIQALRAVRGSGGFRFIVNPHGIVLTKVEDDPFIWQPKYVGRIDYERWFPREYS